jgi:glycosyltransferase involved in cell wall biosynthesis
LRRCNNARRALFCQNPAVTSPPAPARTPLSAVVITLNAAHQIEPCLVSLGFADEIVVVDSGSSDGTTERARSRGARVVHQDWLGYGPQKQFACDQAAHDWVLAIDADERVTPQLREAIERALRTPEFKAYQFPRRNRFLGRYLRHGEGYPDWSLRLFDRRHGRWSDDVVHERVLTLGPVGRLEGDLLHESAESLDDYLAKQNRYSSLAAADLHREGHRASASRLVLSPLMRFIKFYLLRRGFLDGLPGFVHIAIGCFASFLKYAKLRALQQSEPPGRAAGRSPDAC